MIEITNLYKEVESNKNKITILKNINLKINKNSIVVIKGASGSGKSTLLSIIGCMSRPSSGEVKIEDDLISKLPDFHSSKFRNKKIGFVFQSFNLIANFTVFENLLCALVPQNLKEVEIEEKILKALKLAKIEHKKNEITLNLSGGEKQRCAIARAIVSEPCLIIADEPTANLDKENSLNFLTIIKELKDKNKTIIIATHDNLFDNLDFIDEVFYMKNGEIISK